MFNKIKKFWEKIEPTVSAILTIIFFLVISFIIFVIFKDSRVFNNNLLNLITLIIFYSAIYLFFIQICYKSLKFIFTKPLLSEIEFKKLWRKECKIARELKKGQENKKIKYGSREFKKRYEQMGQINKKLKEKTITFKNWFDFFIFSIYFGLLEGIPFWAIKHSAKYFLKAIKHFFSLKRYGLGFMWYKLKGGKYIIDYFIYPYVKPKKQK